MNGLARLKRTAGTTGSTSHNIVCEGLGTLTANTLCAESNDSISIYASPRVSRCPLPFINLLARYVNMASTKFTILNILLFLQLAAAAVISGSLQT